MVDDIPSTDKKKHKKHKKDKKERMETSPPVPNLDLHTSPDFAPNELLTELEFDVSPSTSSSTSSSTTTHVMDEKTYDLNLCLCHNCNLELFQAKSNMEWFIKCPFSNTCGLFSHRNEENAYVGVLNRKVHNIYRKLKGEVRCECNNQASLKVSKSAFNPGRLFFCLS